MPYNSDGSHQDSNRVSLGGLWQQTDKNGNKYLSGSLGGFAKLLIFPNRNKNSDTAPDYTMVLVEKQRKEDASQSPQQGNSAPNNTPPTPQQADDDAPF